MLDVVFSCDLTQIHFCLVYFTFCMAKVNAADDKDGWMDGWLDRWVDGWMDGWMDGY